MMKLGIVISYLKKIQKTNHMTHSLSSPDISIFSLETSNCCYFKKYRNGLHFNTWFLILLTFFDSLKVVLIDMLAILTMSAKVITLGLFKRKVIWSKDYDIIISVNDVTNKISSLDLNHIVGVIISFVNSSIFMREVIITSILSYFNLEPSFKLQWCSAGDFFGHKFQQPQEGLNSESIAFEVVT